MRYIVEAPDGTRHIIEGPDPQAITAEQQKPAATPQELFTQIGGAVSEPLASIAASAFAKPASEAAGLFGMLIGRDPEADRAAVRKALTYEPRTAAGKAITASPANPLNMFGSVVGSISRGAHDLIANKNDPAHTPTNMLANAVQEAIPQALSIYGVRGELPPGVKAATKPITAVGGPVLNVIGEVGRQLRDTVRNFTPAGQNILAESHLRNTASYGGDLPDIVKAAQIAGKDRLSAPTATEAIAEANMGAGRRFGGPILRTQQELSRLPETSSKLRSLEVAQENVRADALKKIAGSAKERASALADVKKAGQEYEAIKSRTVESNTALNELSQSPAFRAAEKRAETISANDNAVRSAAGESPIPFKEGTSYSVQGLQHIKQVLDDMAETPQLRDQLGITGTEAFNLKSVRSALVKWMDNNIEGWTTARVNYRNAKNVVNRMDIAELLGKKLTGVRGEERAGQFLQAIEDVPNVIKKATGKPLGKKIEDIFTPEQIRTINKIAGELKVEGMASRMANEVNVPGAANPVTGNMAGLPPILYRPNVIANWFLHRGGESGNRAVNMISADILSSPPRLAAVLSKMPPARRFMIMQALSGAWQGASPLFPAAVQNQSGQ